MVVTTAPADAPGGAAFLRRSRWLERGHWLYVARSMGGGTCWDGALGVPGLDSSDDVQRGRLKHFWEETQMIG